MSISGLLAPSAARVDHMIVPLTAGEGFRRAAKAALAFARRRSRRLTLLLVAPGPLGSLDLACRQLAAALRDGFHAACEVKLVVRNGDAPLALRDLVRRDPADLVLVPAQSGGAAVFGEGFGCPVVDL